MLKILLICTAGMSTSFLVEKMKKEAEVRNLEVEIMAIPEASSDEFVDKVDIVLLGPQIKYLENDIKAKFVGIPVGVINMTDYGMMKGDKVLDFALSMV
ncbi:PTS sugar transporter subunit IIB [Streptobacillus moniliformis]|uniref:Phosphotransferase system lactose/cellobiose-specific IIB subunit n=1 Tax=Streptobacillus moniliformis (strain ATCC 14647 / DSM 12112 / NCTC 10651 / 9901) TaxID=519441 RepID=D1AWK9_STRM9|nr:PTS sugar transporter subunit IIB [Streptobacillus moniliformis]ACZ00685.1 phosphotransferase system lactose/cellobiose- specific IIB subunit [Streptobacillus moniliformis DSM 12112]AVL42915.1 PTS sugar transporter subunit IIB [Streptobacillus moniliformis]QXW65444.1 PTS sugar transporter subunit IIB [Streptobacillus moniliformis]SQA14188.1 Lichenan-specific phosphotransferase enzyme IIB component [Streptobacillus moniliformis]SQA14382.1 Lichenan-specific phosphotransferase enzyme IIB compo